MLPLSSAVIAEKNKLSSDGVFLVLLQIDMPDSDTIRVVRNTEDITWPTTSGHPYIAFPFELDEISENSKGEVPRVALRVSNVSRALEPYLEQGKGGVGATVTIRVVHSKHLDLTTPEVELVFDVISTTADSQWVTFTLGASNPFKRRFPQGRFIKNFCRWKFKSTECGYSGLLATCDKTLNQCRARENSDRFGGFPSVGSSALYG